MNIQNTTTCTTIFQDRDLRTITPVAVAPVNSWKQLTAGDEQAETFEGILRMTHVISLLCALVICALGVRTVDNSTESTGLAAPSFHVPAMIEQAPAAVKAAVSSNAAF